MISSSKAIDNLLFRYTHLSLAGRQVRVPYWMDKIKKKIWGPYGGKGAPEELVGATIEAAKQKRIDLGKLTAGQIRTFMKRNRIGVDCSGLVFNLLNALDKEKGGNGLVDDIPGARGKFLVRASVAMLTNEEVSRPIAKISDCQVGDMIRCLAGKHLLVVVKVKKDGKGKVQEIVYAHSSPKTKIDGVHTYKILIINEGLGLEKQSWLETTKKGENYGRKFFQPENGDGIRRLKIWA